MTIHVAPHTRKRPLAAEKFAVCKAIIRDLKSEREAKFQADMKKMDRALNRLVAFNVRREMA